MTQLYKRNGAVFIPVWITIEEIEQLEKENAELKEQIEQLSNDNHVLKTSFIIQQEQIDKMKNKLNCSKYHYCLCKDIVCKDCKDWKMENAELYDSVADKEIEK